MRFKKMHYLRLLTVVFVALTLFGCASDTDIQSSVDEQTAQELQQMINQRIATYDIPGMVMAIKRVGMRTWTGVGGVSDLEDGTPLKAEDKFRIGSNTKTFVAMTILQLAQEGYLDLDDSLEDWLPGVLTNYNNYYDSQDITIRLLLNHTSGILNFTEDYDNWAQYYLDDRTKQWTPQQLIAIGDPDDYPPYFAPGQGFHYSNTNYVLLGLIIEEITGNTYEDEVSRRFFDRLGLSDTVVPITGESMPTGNFSHGYYDTDNDGTIEASEDYTEQDPSFTWASGNMLSIAGDLAKWVIAVGQGTLIDEEYHNEQFTFVDMPEYDTLEYGLGIIHDSDGNLYGHQGGTIGYTSVMFYVAEENTSIVCLINRSMPTDIKNYSEVIVYDALSVLFPEKAALFREKIRRMVARPKTRPEFLREY